MCNEFREWVGCSSEELDFWCLKEAQRDFYTIHSHIVKPFLHKAPGTFLLPAPFVEPLPAPSSITEFGSISGSKEVMIVEHSGPTPSMLMKTLKQIKAENTIVRERLDKQDEILKAHCHTPKFAH